MGSTGRTLVVWAIASGCLSSPPVEPPDEPERCGTLSSMSEDFEGGLSSWLWNPEGLWGADGGSVQLTPTPETLSAISSRQSWRVEGGELVVGVDTAAMAPDAILDVWLIGEEGAVALSLDAGVIRANVIEAGFEGTRDSAAYDPETRWWRIGRAGGRMQWATSRNRTDWIEQGEFDADLAGLADLSIQHITRGNSSVVTVDAINPAPSSEPPCRLDSFRDDFSGDLDPRWRILSEDLCEVRIVDDRAELGLSAADACGLVTRQRLSMAENEVSVELADAGDCELNPTLHVGYNGASVEMTCHPGSPPMLTAVAFGEDWGEDLGMTDFDPIMVRFLRMRHAPAEGGLLFETSPDRTSWSRLGLWDDFDPAVLTSVEVGLLVYSDTPGANVVAFDELNTTP